MLATASNVQDFLGKSKYDTQMAAYSAQKLVKDWGRFHLPGYGLYRDIQMGARARDPRQAFFAMTMGRPELLKSNWFGHLLDEPQLLFDPRTTSDFTYRPEDRPAYLRLEELIRANQDTVWGAHADTLTRDAQN